MGPGKIGWISRTSHRVKHPAVATFLWECLGQPSDVLLGSHNLPNTQTQPLNPPPSFLTNFNQTERSSRVSKEWRTSSTGRQSCAGISGSTCCSSRSTAGRISQSQKITEKTQVFCEVDGGLLTSCYKMTFFVAEVRCQTHKLKNMYLYILV